MGGAAVVAEPPAANAEIQKIKDEIAAMKDRVAQEFRKQTNLIKGKAKESKEAAESARDYIETEIGKLNANIKTKNDSLGKRIKESFALRDKEIGRLKEENQKLGEENKKLRNKGKAMKLPPPPKAKQQKPSPAKTPKPSPAKTPKPSPAKTPKPSPGKTPKRPQDEDKVSPSPKKPKPSKPSPEKGKTKDL
ncbi:hypothetical protein MHUMG1_07925 [Metarhizium humberi]|uniref:Uncharacterized protein n=1 Tax=Metarhizium humberi TaxID=2596975 RepID=A0A9P8M5U5_9HYPO|nr:hypothetical protein MHUMG1_07925 [Metarhizium humberi]